MLTQHELRQILRYDPDTGLFYRLTDKRSGKPSGKQTGTLRRDGYVVVFADKIRTAHRLAFLYMTGSFPVHDIDHANGVRSDNRWCNLREVEHSRNMQNQRAAMVTNRVGLLGVSQDGNRFTAQIMLAGKSKHLGTFGTPEEAHAAYVAAKRELHPASTL